MPGKLQADLSKDQPVKHLIKMTQPHPRTEKTKNQNRLSDRVAIITGGGRGLGRDIARAYALEGALLVISGTSVGALAATEEEIRQTGARVIAVTADVSDEKAVENLVQATIAEYGRVDILVNNAGIAGPTALVTDVSREDWDHTIAVNLTGAYLCSKTVIPHMAAQHSGKIINISSIAGHIGYALRSPYAVSKWGMIGLSQTLAQEWGKLNIQVNTISPGPVSGDRIDEVIRRRAERSGRTADEIRAEYTARLALERFVDPEHVAETAVFLASSASDSITGEVIRVSSGHGLA